MLVSQYKKNTIKYKEIKLWQVKDIQEYKE